MSITNREVPQVVVNKLTQAQYDAATKVQDEFYLITDAPNSPVAFTDGTTTVYADAAGVVNISSLIPATNNINSTDWSALWQ